MDLARLVIGLPSTCEVVWCGDQPVVLRGLTPGEGEGSKFVLLTKDKYSDLCRCLLGASQRRSMMGKTRVFQDITALRNDACGTLFAEVASAAEKQDEPDA